MIIIHISPEVSPYVSKSLFIPYGLFWILPCNTIVIGIVFLETEFHKVVKISRMIDMSIFNQCPDRVPHVPEFI